MGVRSAEVDGEVGWSVKHFRRRGDAKVHKAEVATKERTRARHGLTLSRAWAKLIFTCNHR